MQRFTHISLLLLVLLSSCTLYTTTSEVDAQLKSTLASVNSNSSSFLTKVADMEKEYLALKCKTDVAPYSVAKTKLEAIDEERLAAQLLGRRRARRFRRTAASRPQ